MSGRRVWLGLLLIAAVFAAAAPPAAATYPLGNPPPLAASTPRTDVAVGVPHWDRGAGAPGRGGTGAAYLVLGGADGQSAGVRALPFPTLPGDDFGAAVVLTFADAAMWVYVGAPGRDASGHADAGAFIQYRIGLADDGGVSIRVLATVTQDSPLIPDAAETGDRFGAVLAPGGAWSSARRSRTSARPSTRA
jgi:hypothetical protein